MHPQKRFYPKFGRLHFPSGLLTSLFHSMGAICYNPNNSTHVIYHQKNIGMAWLPFVLEIVFIFAIVALLLNKYMPVQKKTIPYYLGIFLGWFLALYVIILMPIDISMVCFSIIDIDFNILIPLGLVR